MLSLAERVRARKNAPPPTADELRRQVFNLESEIDSAERDLAEHNEHAEFLTTDEAARAVELAAMLPIRRRALERLRESLAAAEKAEAVAKLKADIAEYKRRTERAAKTFAARYAAAAEAFAAVIRELDDSAEERRLLGVRGSELGVEGAHPPHLEVVVRGEELQNGWRILRGQQVLDIHGRVIGAAPFRPGFTG
jgi:predicted  nucleic acid-binding Zn-ribbon protein